MVGKLTPTGRGPTNRLGMEEYCLLVNRDLVVTAGQIRNMHPFLESHWAHRPSRRDTGLGKVSREWWLHCNQQYWRAGRAGQPDRCNGLRAAPVKQAFGDWNRRL